MRSLSVLPLLLLLGCLACSAPRQQAFDPGAYAPYAGTGTGIVEGRAAVLDETGAERVAAGLPVVLQPATAYGEEWYARAVLGGEELDAPDPRLTPFLRTVTSGADGSFRFTGVPAGDWILTCRVTWRTAGLESRFSTHGEWAAARLHVSEGETVEVIIGR